MVNIPNKTAAIRALYPRMIAIDPAISNIRTRVVQIFAYGIPIELTKSLITWKLAIFEIPADKNKDANKILATTFSELLNLECFIAMLNWILL